MTPSVLILGSLYDFAIDIVVRRLRESAVCYLRLNREQLADLRICLDPVERSMSIRGLGIDATLGPGLQSIWYRSPVFVRNATLDHTPADQLARSQWSAFLRSMMVFDEARWMNHPADAYKAETKPFQLLMAHRLGFAVPRTLVSNDPVRSRERFPEKLALKSIDTVYLRENEDALFAYTSIIDSSKLSDENFQQVPSITQEFISPKIDLRVTVVGDSAFAYKILANGQAAGGDWRLHRRDELSYQPYSLPDDVKDRCVSICRALNLPFGAIDLIESDGRIVFVEINPTGEWAWLPNADSTAGAAIADWLSSPKE